MRFPKSDKVCMCVEGYIPISEKLYWKCELNLIYTGCKPTYYLNYTSRKCESCGLCLSCSVPDIRGSNTSIINYLRMVHPPIFKAD